MYLYFISFRIRSRSDDVLVHIWSTILLFVTCPHLYICLVSSLIYIPGRLLCIFTHFLQSYRVHLKEITQINILANLIIHIHLLRAELETLAGVLFFLFFKSQLVSPWLSKESLSCFILYFRLSSVPVGSVGVCV